MWMSGPSYYPNGRHNVVVPVSPSADTIVSQCMVKSNAYYSHRCCTKLDGKGSDDGNEVLRKERGEKPGMYQPRVRNGCIVVGQICIGIFRPWT